MEADGGRCTYSLTDEYLTNISKRSIQRLADSQSIVHITRTEGLNACEQCQGSSHLFQLDLTYYFKHPKIRTSCFHVNTTHTHPTNPHPVNNAHFNTLSNLPEVELRRHLLPLRFYFYAPVRRLSPVTFCQLLARLPLILRGAL
jgi:hypothetical protein